MSKLRYATKKIICKECHAPAVIGDVDMSGWCAECHVYLHTGGRIDDSLTNDAKALLKRREKRMQKATKARSDKWWM